MKDFNNYVENNILSLTSWTISSQDIKSTLEFIEKNPKIKSLNLSMNKISEKGIKELAASQTFTKLTTLDLSWNNLGDEGAKTLASSMIITKLITLNLSRNNIGKVGAKALSTPNYLTNLIVLNLSENNICDEGAKLLALSMILTNLIDLNLSRNDIGDTGIIALASSKHLVNLITFDLSKNNIGDVGIIALVSSQYLTKLITLDLFRNNIGDEGAKAIADSYNLKNLNDLNLSWNNKIGATGEIDLAKFSSQNNLIPLLTTTFMLLISAFKENNGNLTEDITKKLVFQLAPLDYNGNYIKYIIEHSKEFPFPIDSLDPEGHNLLYIYNGHLRTQALLFDHGLSYKKEEEPIDGKYFDSTLLCYTQQNIYNSQSNNIIIPKTIRLIGSASSIEDDL